MASISFDDLSFFPVEAEKFFFGNTVIQCLSTHYSVASPETFEEIQRIQKLLNLANIGAIFFTVFKTLSVLDEYTHVFTAAAGFFEEITPHIFSIGGFFAWLVISKLVDDLVKNINKKATEKQTPLECLSILDGKTYTNEKNMQLEWHSPYSKTLIQSLHLTQVILCTALIILSTSPCFYGLCALSHVNSLYTLADHKWVRLTSSKDLGNKSWSGAQKIFSKYAFPLFDNLDKTKKCLVCNEKGATLTYHKDHVFHAICLTESLNEKNNEFLKNLPMPQRFLNQDYQNGILVNEYISYEGKASKELILTCPDTDCDARPSFNKTDVIIEDKFEGKIGNITAKIHYVDPNNKGFFSWLFGY